MIIHACNNLTVITDVNARILLSISLSLKIQVILRSKYKPAEVLVNK